LVQKKNTERIDILLVQKGMVSTRARAQSMIIAGNVLVDDKPITKPGTAVPVEAQIRLREPESKYVSRGALKLKKAIEDFRIDLSGKVALDVGASTGGFSEILLEYGIEKVHAIDVGTNQLAWKIRSNPKVHSKENYNARYLKYEDFGIYFDIIVMDVSFISIKLIMPQLTHVSKKGTEFIVLFKPQFEVGKDHVEAGGIVRDQAYAQKVLEETVAHLNAELGISVKNMVPSPILGTDGNHEYLIHWIKL
jgi:23S rRNA (cytidine1920-2'-O)/16S rRNA (cytidine1409-2'-O)-methyltransferase